MKTDLKLKLYPALIGVLTTVIVILVFGRWMPALWNSSSLSPGSNPESMDRPLALPGLSAIATVSWTETLERSETEPPPVVVAAPLPTASNEVGSFRVSNSTSHVVRVVLLAQDQAPPSGERYREPVHWDFAPGEGVGKGLILSLPDGELQLQTNDVLMAFSLDGSQRYWGPYVVGQTASPTWSGNSGEWTLELTSQP